MAAQSEFAVQKQDLLEKINVLRSGLEKEEEALLIFREKVTDYAQLKTLTEKLILNFSLNDVCKILVQSINDILKYPNVTVILYLFHRKRGELGLVTSQKGQEQINVKAKKGDIFDHYVLKTMQPLWIEDVKSDFRFDAGKIQKEDDRAVQSLMSVPMMSGSRIIGILRADSFKGGHFTADDLRLFTTIADLGGITIENAQLFDRLEDLAIKDSLTGLCLRRYLQERLAQEISRHLRTDKKFSFLMLDLDKFKQYNDKFGHMAGDIVLKAIGAILQDSFKNPGDLICRYGGEEFAVILPEMSKKQALKLAEDVRKKIELNTIILRREKTRITASIGVSAFPDDAKLKDDLIRKADEALYRAKAMGRNKVCGA